MVECTAGDKQTPVSRRDHDNQRQSRHSENGGKKEKGEDITGFLIYLKGKKKVESGAVNNRVCITRGGASPPLLYKVQRVTESSEMRLPIIAFSISI